MNTLFSLPVMAAGAPGGQADGSSMLVTILMFGAIMLIFYFLILRPQNKKQKEHQKMLAAVKKGDRVETIGGIRGIVSAVKDDSIILKVDDNAKLEFVRSAVGKVLEVKAVSATDKVISKADGSVETDASASAE